MNTYYFNDSNFKELDIYKNFIKENSGNAYLDIRTSAASEAIPVSGVKIIISKIIDNNKIIFYEGLTDNSGMINNINLPTPIINTNDLVVPIGTIYNIEAIYNDINKNYSILMYNGITFLQNINIVPTIDLIERSKYNGI